MGVLDSIIAFLNHFYELILLPVLVHFPEVAPYLGSHPVLETATIVLLVYLVSAAIARLLTSLKDYFLTAASRTKVHIQEARVLRQLSVVIKQ